MIGAADLRGARVLITGGLGFIGSNLAWRLAEAGAKLTLVDSLIPQYGGNRINVEGLDREVVINISDVRDTHSFARLLEGQDFLFNLAGQTSHLDSMQDPYTDLEINAKAQLSILEAARQVNPKVKVVFASTRQIYGKPAYLPVDEKHLIRPVDVNGVNKAAGEAYHILYNNVYGIRASCLRLTNTYGPRMRIKDARQTFVGMWVRRALEGEAFEVWGGDQLRDFNYVDDCIDALLAATAPVAAGKIYNLGGAEVVRLKQLGALLQQLVPGARFDIKDFPEERKRIDIGDFYASHALITAELGWQPKVGLRQGLLQTLKYFKPRLGSYLA